MSFNALLENINRKNRSYGQVGNQSPAARIQRMNPLLDTMSAVPIGPNVVSQVNVPGAQNIGAPQARGVPLLPFAQNMPAPAAQPMPVGEDVAPPNVIPLNTPATEEIEPTNIQLDDPEEVVSEDDTFFNQISRAASQGVEGVQQWASGVAQDDEKMGKLILALNSMRRKPDAGIAAAAREQIKGAQAERTSNRTIEYLKSQGASSTFMEIAKTDPNKALIEFEKSKKPVDRKTLEDAAGYKRYADTGERVFPGVEKGKDRKIIEDVAGRQRYADTGELTFPDIDVPADRKIIEDVAGYKRYQDTGERVFPGAEKENGKTGAPGTRAGGVILDDFINSFGPVKGAYAYDQYVQKQKEKVQQAGVPQQVPGKIELGDIQDYRTKIQTELKPFNDPLDSIKQGRVLARDALKGNEHSEKQLDKVLAQVAGDRQTSMLEVNRLAHSEELLLSAADTISRWFSGTSTDFTTEQKVEVLDALEDFRNAQRNARIDKLHEAYSLSSTDPRIIDSVLPPKAQMIPRNARAAGVTSKMWGLFTEEEKKEWR